MYNDLPLLRHPPISNFERSILSPPRAGVRVLPVQAVERNPRLTADNSIDVDECGAARRRQGVCFAGADDGSGPEQKKILAI